MAKYEITLTNGSTIVVEANSPEEATQIASRQIDATYTSQPAQSLHGPALAEQQQSQDMAQRNAPKPSYVPEKQPVKHASMDLPLQDMAAGASRGMAPYAAGASLGAAAGAPFAGVGAIPGAAAGIGAVGLAQFVGDPVINAVNSFFGTQYTTPTEALNQLMDAAGMPKPQTEAGQMTEKITGAGASALTGVGLGRAMAAGSAPGTATQAVGQALAQAPMAQVASGASAGAAADLARQAGAPPLLQAGAGLLGGLAGGVTGQMIGSRPGFRSGGPGFQAPLEQDFSNNTNVTLRVPIGQPSKVPMTYEDVSKAARTAARGGMGSKQAEEALARAAPINKDAAAAAERLGIDVPPDVLMDHTQLKEAVGLTRSMPGTLASASWADAVERAAGQADEAMALIDGSADLSEVSDTVLKSMQGTQKALQTQSDDMYKLINARINGEAAPVAKAAAPAEPTQSWYHSGTIAPGESVDVTRGELGFHVGAKQSAEIRARDFPSQKQTLGEYDVQGKFARVPDLGQWGPDDYLYARGRSSAFSEDLEPMWKELDALAKRDPAMKEWTAAVQDAAKRNGISGWEYKNVQEGGGMSRIVMDPQAIGAKGSPSSVTPLKPGADVAALKQQGFNTDKVYYHGGDVEFDTFDMAKAGRREVPWYGRGAYLTPDSKIAKNYAAGGKVMPFYVRGKMLQIRKPEDWPSWLNKEADIPQQLKDRGYVGIDIDIKTQNPKYGPDFRPLVDKDGKLIMEEGSAPEVVVFDPANIVRADKSLAATPTPKGPPPTVDLVNSRKLMDSVTADLGGDTSKLTSLEKELAEMASPGRKTPVTYSAMMRMKSDVGQALEKASGPYKDVNSGILKRLYGALAEDQLANVERIGGKQLRDDLRLANQLTAKRKALEDRIVSLFGDERDGSIAKKLVSAVKGGAQGDITGFNRLVKSIPQDLRKKAVATAIAASAREEKTNGFGFAKYVDLYQGLRRNSEVYKTVVETLGPDSDKFLRDLYEISKRIKDARANVMTTGKANQALVQGLMAEGVVEKVLRSTVGRQATMGGATAVGGVMAGPAAGAASAMLVNALSKSSKNGINAAGDLFASPEWQQLVVNISTENRVNTKFYNAAKNSKPFQRWTKAVGITDPDAWLRSALASTIGIGLTSKNEDQPYMADQPYEAQAPQ